MHLRKILPTLLATSLFAAAAPSHAVIINGSFAGTAANSSWREIVDGAPIYGNFVLDTSNYVPNFNGPDHRVGHYGGDVKGFNFRFFAPWTGLEYSMGMGFGSLDLYDNGVTQTVDILLQFVHGQGTHFRLSAPSGTLFTDIADLSGLHAAPLDLGASSIHFDDHQGIGFDLDIARLSIAEVGTVPEPASGALLLGALGAAGLVRRRTASPDPSPDQSC